MKRFRMLAAACMLLTFAVVALGAYVRLKDAGLGCPDWPGCYGQIVGVPTPAEARKFAPDAPLDSGKAWIEVIHRYIAAALALLVLALVAVGLRARIGTGRTLAAAGLAIMVALQALLGMLTVTERLMPAVVTAHLLGGMLILAASAAIVATPRRLTSRPPSAALKTLAIASLALLFVQIALGGWVSSNYAGLSCPDFPLCGGELVPDGMDAAGFAPARDLGRDAGGAPITQASLTGIHWAHRAGALALFAVVGAYSVLLLREAPRFGAGAGLLAILALQVAVGIANVVYQLPLLLAWLHNVLAAILAVNLAVLGARILLFRQPADEAAGTGTPAHRLAAGAAPTAPGSRRPAADSIP